MLLTPGTVVRCEMTKWGDRPHWEYDAVHLGADEHGDWLGFPSGTRFTRPGRSFVQERAHVGLVPSGLDQPPWHLATFYEDEGPTWPTLGGAGVAVYVDITTPPVWAGSSGRPILRAVDLDLDVVRSFNDQVIVDDEDEFAEHQVAYGYPPDVVAAARVSCEAVLAAVLAGDAPYDGTHRRWMDRLTELQA